MRTKKICLPPDSGGSMESGAEPASISIYRRRKRMRLYTYRQNGSKRGVRVLLTLVFLALFLYGTIHLISYEVDRAEVKRTNRELQLLYEQSPQVNAPGMLISQPSDTRDSLPGLAALAVPTDVPLPSATPTPSLRETYQYVSGEILPEMVELIRRNPDTIAWLEIPGVVSLPVVYRNNIYYTDHDFDGNQSRSGALFLDEAHPFLSDTQYLVIHGHNMKDGSMFGVLSHYCDRSYMTEHPTARLTTRYRRETYEVIGCLCVPVSVQAKGYTPFNGMRKFRSVEHFKDFFEKIRMNALYWKLGTDIRPDDALLALSTCYDSDRIVVLCRRLGAAD